MTKPTEGYITAAIQAGHISKTSNPPGPKIGQQVSMAGATTYIYITPEVARQWLPVIQQIAEEK